MLKEPFANYLKAKANQLRPSSWLALQVMHCWLLALSLARAHLTAKLLYLCCRYVMDTGKRPHVVMFLGEQNAQEKQKISIEYTQIQKPMRESAF